MIHNYNMAKNSIEIQEDYEPLIERENKYIMYVYYGGRGGGKSIGITDAIISLCLISKENAFCGREIKADNDKSIAETFAERLKYWSDVGAIDKRLYTIKRDNISFLNGSKITFTGFSEITIDGMKSTGATICWVDEAHSLTKRVIDLLLPSVRGKNSKGQKPISIFSFNRQLINDPIYVEAKSRTDCYLKQVNFEDNNFFYDNEALKTLIIQDREKLQKHIITQAEFNHTWYGEPFVEEDVLIPYELIQKNFDFVSTDYDLYLPSIGIDVARSGHDATCIKVIQGNKLIEELEFHNLNGDQLSEKVIRLYDSYNNKENDLNKNRIQMFIDSCGVGASLIDCLNIKGYSRYVVPVNFASSPEDERYYNKRAECYGRAKEKLENGFDFNGLGRELIEQLAYVPYDYKRSDKLKIVDKDIIKKKLGRSPDDADAFVLTFASLSNKLRETNQYTINRWNNRKYTITRNNCLDICNIFGVES